MINSKSTMSLQPNGNNTPVWKALGYASYQDYINATSGANGNKGVISPWQGSQAPVSVYDGLKTPSVKMPSLDKYANFIGGGTGGSTGGVTKEGVVIGNPNVNNSTFNNITSGSKVTSGSTEKKTVTTQPTPTTPTAPAQEETTPPPVARTDEGSYNGTSSFLEWYKENYGVDYDPSVGFSRREGMNDGVWNVGTNLYNYYLQGLDDERRKADEEANRNTYYDEQLETLLGEYSASREALDKSKRQSQQNASITLDKLKKYLPTQIKAQGLGGLGVSESTMLQAYNNYNNDMGAIESDYQANKTSLDTGETASKNTLENYRQDALKAIADKYNAAADARRAEAGQTSSGIFSAYETQVREQMRQAFEDAYSTISGSASTSADELIKYVESLRGKVSEENFNSLMTKAQQVANNNLEAKQQADRENAYVVAQATIEELIGNGETDKAREYLEANKDILGESVYNSYMTSLESRTAQIEKEKSETEQAEIDKRVLEGKEYVSYGGAEYQIKSQLDTNANEIRDNESFTKKLKSLGFTNPYDQNIPNGTSFEISCDAYGSDKVDWKDFVGWLLGPTNIAINHSVYKKTVTYYNGNWYISEKK